MSEMDKMLQKMKHNSAGREQDRDDYVASTRPQSRKRRAIDEFLEEMKERGPSEVYPAEEPRVSMKGSFDNGDPETTNLYVGNLAPTVTEEALEVRLLVVPFCFVGLILIHLIVSTGRVWSIRSDLLGEDHVASIGRRARAQTQLWICELLRASRCR